MRSYVEAGYCRLLVVDAQIQCGDRAGAVERELYRHAATLIQHRGDNAAMKHPPFGVSNEDRAEG
jgi:hypothetical protein